MSRSLPFTKMHGAGNDFVVFDGLRDELPRDLSQLAQDISDRHFAVGFDQMLVVRPVAANSPNDGDNRADFRMDIYNADGSQVEMCANGIRAFYKYLRDADHTQALEIGVETLSGVVRPRWAGEGKVTVDMGSPVLIPEKIPTTLATGAGPVLDVPIDLPMDLLRDCLPELQGPLLVSAISMGNPHCVIQVADIDALPLDRIGPALEHHVAFPNRVNVEFIQIVSRDRIRQRTWERGTGETLACGSGACAVAVASMLRDVIDREVAIELRGGELQIGWADKNASVFMTGPAATVFTGVWPTDLE